MAVPRISYKKILGVCICRRFDEEAKLYILVCSRLRIEYYFGIHTSLCVYVVFYSLGVLFFTIYFVRVHCWPLGPYTLVQSTNNCQIVYTPSTTFPNLMTIGMLVMHVMTLSVYLWRLFSINIVSSTMYIIFWVEVSHT